MSRMVKHYYIQDYRENFRGNTDPRKVACGFIWPSMKSILNLRERKNAHGEGWWLTRTIRTEVFHELLT